MIERDRPDGLSKDDHIPAQDSDDQQDLSKTFSGANPSHRPTIQPAFLSVFGPGSPWT